MQLIGIYYDMADRFGLENVAVQRVGYILGPIPMFGVSVCVRVLTTGEEVVW